MAESQSELERSFETWWRVLAPPEAPQPEREYRFHDQRRWRFDYAFIDQRVAIELEGGIYSGGGIPAPKGISVIW